MKKIFTFFVSLCLCGSAFAAGKGEAVAATNVFSGKLLGSITNVTDGEVCNLTYNSQGQLVSAKATDNGWEETTVFDYTGGTVNGIDYDVKVTLTDTDVTSTLYITVGDNHFAASVYQEDYDYIEGKTTATWTFEYNAEGNLVKINRSEGGSEVTTITYKDGDIVKVQMVDGMDYDSWAISYGSLIENTAGVMFFDETFGIDTDEMAITYYAGLLGRPTKHLPERKVDNEGEAVTFDWTIAEGYPSKLVCTDGTDRQSIAFTWIESAGIESIEAADVKVPAEYYNLQGVRVAAPTSGLYIVRNTDGSTSKVYL